MKPKIGPTAFDEITQSVVRLLRGGEVVMVEMAVRKGDRKNALTVLNRLVWLAESVGEVRLFDTGEQGQQIVLLAPISPPSGEAGSPMPAVPSGTL
jgi:hypothetical protein